jgi:hypothetical protein
MFTSVHGSLGRSQCRYMCHMRRTSVSSWTIFLMIPTNWWKLRFIAEKEK